MKRGEHGATAARTTRKARKTRGEQAKAAAVHVAAESEQQQQQQPTAAPAPIPPPPPNDGPDGPSPSAWEIVRAEISGLADACERMRNALQDLLQPRQADTTAIPATPPPPDEANPKHDAIESPATPQADVAVRSSMPADLGCLTQNDREVLELIGQGLSNKDIAATRHRTRRSIESTRYRMKIKLGIDNAAKLAHLAWTFTHPATLA